MAWRGGRGGRGGRGFGGRGAPLVVARDDDGLVMAPERPDGPPPLFPPMELPELPDITPRDLQLLGYRRHLEQAFLGSPYYIERTKKKPAGVEADITRYSDQYRRGAAMSRAPLSSVLKLTLAHFPGELLDSSSKIKAAPSRGVTPWKVQKTGGNDLQRLDLLEKIEQKTEKAGDKEGKDDEEKKKEEGEEDEEDLEEEEEEFGDDDYAQAFGFDDDDGYGDLDEGDDEGPVF